MRSVYDFSSETLSRRGDSAFVVFMRWTCTLISSDRANCSSTSWGLVLARAFFDGREDYSESDVGVGAPLGGRNGILAAHAVENVPGWLAQAFGGMKQDQHSSCEMQVRFRPLTPHGGYSVSLIAGRLL